MSTLTTSLIKRGYEAHVQYKDSNVDLVKIDAGPVLMVVLGITVVGLVFSVFLVEYTFGRVVPTLLMIESPPEDLAFEPLPTKDTSESRKALLENREDVELLPARPKYITSNFRQSLKLLKEYGGRREYFRALRLFFVETFVMNIVAGMLLTISPVHLPDSFYFVVASIICAQLSLGWTLSVISQSNKPWYRRIPPFASWKKVAGPTAVIAVVRHAAVMIPVHLGVEPVHEKLDDKVKVVKALASIVLLVVLLIVVVAPAATILTRVQASMISDAEETIVPFDRTFEGRFVPASAGGRGVLGMCDAWRTFGWGARFRLAKAYAKVIALFFGVMTFFSLVVLLEVFVASMFA